MRFRKEIGRAELLGMVQKLHAMQHDLRPNEPLAKAWLVTLTRPKSLGVNLTVKPSANVCASTAVC